MKAELISALAIAITGFVTGVIAAIGLCMRQTHMKHLKCCNVVEVDMASTPKDSLEVERAVDLKEISISK